MVDTTIFGLTKSGNDPAQTGPSRLTDEEIQTTVRILIESASQFITSDIQPTREKADLYYKGRTTLKITRGRSKVVVTKVRDAVKGVLPSLARIFTQSDTLGEFYSDDEEDQNICTEQTVYVNSVFSKNNGYVSLMHAVTDALKAKVGVVECHYETKEVVFSRQIDVPPPPAQPLGDGSIGAEMPAGMPAGMPPGVPTVPGMPPATADSMDTDIDTDSDPFEEQQESSGSSVEEQDDEGKIITTKSIRSMWTLEAVPPEEFIIDGESTGIANARIHGRLGLMSISSVIAMGFDYEDLIGISSESDTAGETEKDTRRDRSRRDAHNTDKSDPTSREILVGRVYVRIDADGDGLPELRRIVTVGSKYKILSNEPVNFSPFAAFKSELQPHQFHPISLAEDLIQDQDAQTALLRSIVDNTSLVNSPRTEVNESVVNIDDVKNGEIGAIIRVTQVGQINELTTPFVAGQTLPVLQYLDEVSEARSGVTKMSQGLAADTLQSTTAAAANQAVTNSSDRIEMMARNIAETGVKDLFIIILKTAIQNIREMVSVKTPKGFVKVNPSYWHDHVSVRANVGLGTNQIDGKKSVLSSMLPIQQLMITQLGLENPLSGWKEARETIRQLAKLNGIHDITPFFPEITPEAMQTVAKMQSDKAQASQQAASADTQAYVQVETGKIQARMQEKQQQLESNQQAQIADLNHKHEAETLKLQAKIAELSAHLDMEKQRMLLEDDRVRDKNDQDFILGAAKVGIAADAADAAIRADRGPPTRTQ